MSDIKISLVIPAYNEEKRIAVCLKNAIENSDGNFCEIIVVDNASVDRTAELARSFFSVKVITENKRGTSNARQAGFLAATGDVVVFIDADCVLPKDWVGKIKKYFVDKKVVAVSGPYKYYDAYWRGPILNLFWWLFVPVTYRLVGYAINGGNFAVRRQALLEIDGFDENILFYGDDADIARRLSMVGKVKFDMALYVFSSSRRFLAQGIFKTYYYYVMSYLWQVLFHKVFTNNNKIIR